MKKKLICLLLSLIICISAMSFVACDKQNTKQNTVDILQLVDRVEHEEIIIGVDYETKKPFTRTRPTIIYTYKFTANVDLIELGINFSSETGDITNRQFVDIAWTVYGDFKELKKGEYRLIGIKISGAYSYSLPNFYLSMNDLKKFLSEYSFNVNYINKKNYDNVYNLYFNEYKENNTIRDFYKNTTEYKQMLITKSIFLQ